MMDQPKPASPPLAVLPLEYAGPAVNPSTTLMRWMTYLSVAAMVLATLAAILNVESVIVSGPVLALLGVIMVVCGFSRRQRALWWPGLAHWGICGLFVGLVNMLHWSPSDARVPFPIMGAIYTVAMTLALLRNVAACGPRE
jgi:hypothetical protein